MLKSIDIFGSEFQFTIFSSQKYKTNIGGLFTIVTAVLIVVFIALFGKEIWFKDNPTVQISAINPEEYPPSRNLGADFQIAWRIYDQDMVTKNIDEYLQMKVLYYYTNGTQKVYKEKIKSMNCEGANITDPHFIAHFNPSEYNCLDLRDKEYLFGGNQDYDNYQTFRIIVTVCDKCSNLTELSNKIGRDTNFEIIYPEMFYDAKADEPLGFHYNMHDQRINIGIKKKDKFYLRNYLSFDDQGWMFRENKPSNVYAVRQYFTDYDYYDLDLYVSEKLPLYECTFSLDKERTEYYRSYMKIQNLTAQVNGVINVILILCKLLTFHFNKYKRNEYLFNEIFEYKRKPEAGGIG
jgi:hypothetical protein